MSSSQQGQVVDRPFILNVFAALGQAGRTIPAPEQLNRIADYAMGQPQAAPAAGNTTVPVPPTANPALVPPRDGSSPFMTLPSELRRDIFASSLPARDVVHGPHCDDDPGFQVSRAPSQGLSGPPGPRRNRISDLMTLNRRIRGEVTEMMYEERSFIIHVHEGLANGGVEFLDAGRQPLQYKDCNEDPRFARFGKDDDFGFTRLKKIIIEIHPTVEDFNRHFSINTYFINIALCRLLERGGGESARIKSLIIRFPKSKKDVADAVGRSAIQRATHYWWDPDNDKPRSTSVHNLSNIELVLRAFATLTACHSVKIELPELVRNHRPTVDFVKALTSSMMSRNGSLFIDDDLAMKIESARDAMEEYVCYVVHGRRPPETPNSATEEDDEGEDGSAASDDSDSHSRKRSLSPHGNGEENGDTKRQARQPSGPNSTFKSMKTKLDEAVDMWDRCRILADHRRARDEEARQYDQAIAESLQMWHEAQGTQPPTSLPWRSGITQRNVTTIFDTQPPSPASGGDLPFRGPGRFLSGLASSAAGSLPHNTWILPSWDGTAPSAVDHYGRRYVQHTNGLYGLTNGDVELHRPLPNGVHGLTNGDVEPHRSLPNGVHGLTNGDIEHHHPLPNGQAEQNGTTAHMPNGVNGWTDPFATDGGLTNGNGDYGTESSPRNMDDFSDFSNGLSSGESENAVSLSDGHAHAASDWTTWTRARDKINRSRGGSGADI